MLDINEVINKYNWITFKSYDNEAGMPDDVSRVSDINEIVGTEKSEKKELEYIWVDYGPEEATDNIFKSLMAMYLLGVAESLEKLWQSENANVDEADKDTQLNLLNALADQLYSGNSSEANLVREKCYAAYFKQLILYDRKANKVFAMDESSKSETEYQQAISFLDETMSKLFKEFVMDSNNDGEKVIQ